MTELVRFHRFRRRYLALTIGLMMLPTAHAMQELSDHSLSDTTGEGVALVLDNFKMVMQGANDRSTASTYDPKRADIKIINPAQHDTGFIRIIPTGENYSQLGERVYQKTYDVSYRNSYLQGQVTYGYATAYNDTYDSVYATQYETLKNQYTRGIGAAEEAKRAELRADLFNAYYNSDLMQRYYDQRYADYYNGTGVLNGNDRLERDGTEVFSVTVGNIIGAQNAAKTNREQMVELLFGKNADVTIPNSTFIRNENFSTTGRTNEIDTSVTNYINQQIADKTASAIERAKSEAEAAAAAQATTVTEALLATIIAQAERDARDAALNSSVDSLRTKADVFIYGLALSKSDGSLSTRFSNEGFNWGTADNPWLLRAGSEKVKQFKERQVATQNGQTVQSDGEEIGYLALEAPLATVAPTETDNNIKLGFWTDIFSRKLDSINEVNPITGAPVWKNDAGDDVSGLDKDFRLRLQFVANGLNFNGSQVRLFQTLPSDNKDYGETFGMASIVRINTNSEPAKITNNFLNTGYVDDELYSRFAKINRYTEAEIISFRTKDDADLKVLGLDRDLISEYTVALARKHQTDSDYFDQRNTGLNAKGMRLSTAETTNDSDADKVPATPALAYGVKAPIFHSTEGLYLYSPNINLVLGNMYQPFVVGSEGNNIILEVTRIPNVASIYKKIYQNYSDITDSKDRTGFEGSTCNVSRCGTQIEVHNSGTIANYQGRNATHSSISIGTTEVSNHMLKAKTGADATGVVFKSINGTSKNLGSVAIDGVLIQHLKIKTTGL